MALSDFRSKASVQREQLLEAKMARANKVADEVLKSDTFKAQVAALPDSVPNVVEAVVGSVVRDLVDPKSNFLDTLTARGFADPSIRRIVRNFSTAFGLTDDNIPYEEKLQVVAEYVETNPWVYDSLNNYK